MISNLNITLAVGTTVGHFFVITKFQSQKDWKSPIGLKMFSADAMDAADFFVEACLLKSLFNELFILDANFI